MPFQVRALRGDRFASLFHLNDDALAATGAVRRVADTQPGFPCRVSLEDADVGEEVLLLNFEHQPATSPFRSRHAIYVRRGVPTAAPAPGEMPQMLRRRTLALRAFDVQGMILAAELATGDDLAPTATQLLATPGAAYLHAHNAAMGCYLARIDAL